MKYLFYDLEEATCKDGNYRICEFGFVQTDAEFNILKKGNAIINPKIANNEWDWYALKKILTRRMRDYLEGETFGYYYPQIRDLFNSSDYVFGYAVSGDFLALNVECQRYKVQSIDCDFYEMTTIYDFYKGERIKKSLSKVIQEENIDGDMKTHDAGADAYNTMKLLQFIINKKKISLNKLLLACPDSQDRNENYKIESIEKKREDFVYKVKHSIEDFDNRIVKHKLTDQIFLAYLDNVRPVANVPQVLKDKKICISLNYEEIHFKQMLNIIQRIYDRGGIYVLKASLSDIFVPVEVLDENGLPRNCTRTKYANEAKDNGSNIDFINFEDFLKLLDLNESELDALDMPSLDFLLDEESNLRSKKVKGYLTATKKEFINKDNSSSIGNLFKEQLSQLKVND